MAGGAVVFYRTARRAVSSLVSLIPQLTAVRARIGEVDCASKPNTSPATARSESGSDFEQGARCGRR